MLYILAILLPPVAVLMTGRPIQVLINVLLTIIGWIPGVIHAMFVVHGSKKS
ncbi:YqaE/Pmp3 family membrane protein [Virgibacillus necropolis]|uniref:YqaE/Pmp3 family membrane protein n=1 Tax=Virgibacillus necropolis TaxID=163877 RepID=A0A221MIQ6_9BACI|nr:YqaE/Pmp3 family membrane protein [Virgibacillus necropolis]